MESDPEGEWHIQDDVLEEWIFRRAGGDGACQGRKGWPNLIVEGTT